MPQLEGEDTVSEIESAITSLAENPPRHGHSLPDSPYSRRVADLIHQQLKIMEDRGKNYGDSWRAEGIDGLMYNIIRKLRRTWHRVMVEGKPPLRDDSMDLANYSEMLQALAELDSESLNRMRVRGNGELFECGVCREKGAKESHA